MSSLKQSVRSIVSASRHGQTLHRLAHARWGIGAILTTAFVAVAILAGSANLIVVNGPSIIRTTEVAPLVDISPAVAPLIRDPIPSPVAEINTDTVVLSAAIDQFSHAVNARAERNAPDNSVQLQASDKAIDQAYARLASHAHGAVGQDQLKKLGTAIRQYKQHGGDAVRLADTRRALLGEFSTRYESMHSRIGGSLERAWRIFGRVVARQSLIKLKASLDVIGQQFAALTGNEMLQPSSDLAVQAAEADFAKTLLQDAAGLTSSQGAAWLAAMREDFDGLVAARSRLLPLDEERRKVALDLASARQPVDSLAAMIASSTTRMAASRLAVADSIRAQNRLDQLIEGQTPAVLSQRSETTTVTPADNGPRLIIAWITAGVLVLLVIISIATVRSIVLPVRRMLDATAKLARGDVGARVAPGGIKELDTLGVAFNTMAEQLAASEEVTRRYQQQLERQVAERTQQLQQLAELDPLTSLPNRRQLATLLAGSIERAARDNLRVGVFFLDVDNFKNINDGMGHTFGDGVLQALAQRLKEVAGNFGFAARLGGDEFTVVYSAARSVEEIRQAGWELVRAFEDPLSINGRDIAVSISVGASLYPDHEQDAPSLLRAADAALFRAKALGRSQLNEFTPDLLELAASKFTTEQGLRRALERGEFELMFQPEMNLQTMQVDMVEALIRWRQADGRLVPPDEFLSIAEESGLIMDVSDWVLRTAIRTVSGWHHGEWPGARVAINVSSRQLIDSTFVEHVMSLLKEYRLPPSCIEIELTETVLQTGAATVEALRQLRSHGVAIALDDFGTGYSSLASLQTLPFTRVKLDRSLMDGIDTNTRSAAIARAIIDLCHILELEITAEGIERPEQLALLLGHRAMHVQGFLLSKPVAEQKLLSVIGSLPGVVQSALLSMTNVEVSGRTDTASPEKQPARLVRIR